MDVTDYDVDVISKLLQKDDQNRSSSDKNNKSKSLRDELTEVGEKIGDASASVSTTLGKSYSLITNCKTKDRFDLQNVMSQFSFLHTLMDREIATVSCDLKVFREQKEAVNAPVMKLRPKVTQLSQGSESLLRGDNQLPIAIKEAYEKKITSLKEALERQKNINKELQNEFNKILNEKESEIEELQSQVYDLKYKLKEHEEGDNELARENEELESKVEIKDEFIEYQRLEIRNFKKEIYQYQWKLEQTDDLLEMVERERDHDEVKYKSAIANLIDILREERLKNQMEQTIHVVPNRVTNVTAIETSDMNSKLQGPPPGFTTNSKTESSPATAVSSNRAKNKSLTKNQATSGNNSREDLQSTQSVNLFSRSRKYTGNRVIPSNNDVVLNSLGWNRKRIE